MVLVETGRLVGGKPLGEIYAVWEPDPSVAQDLVKRQANVLDEKILILNRVSADILAALQIPQGGCRVIKAA